MNTMTVTAKACSVTVPAGRYFLGDPCYAVPDEYWEPLLDSCDFFDGSPVGQANGSQVLAFGTAWGDGTYNDQHGNSYPVDAGLIGLTPIALAQQRDDFEELEGLGRFVDFEGPTTCTKEAGVLTFGKYAIDTDESDTDHD
jgi:hypothetical protein